MTNIWSGHITLEDDGEYQVTVVDFMADTTHTIKPVPDRYIGMLPMLMAEIQQRLGGP